MALTYFFAKLLYTVANRYPANQAEIVAETNPKTKAGADRLPAFILSIGIIWNHD